MKDEQAVGSTILTFPGAAPLMGDPAFAVDGPRRKAGIRAARQDMPCAEPEFTGLTNRYRQGGKRLLDMVLVLAGLPLVVPLSILIAAVLAIEGKGIFYTHQRLGRNGRVFRMLKFRTMVPDADRCLHDHLCRDPALRCEWDRTQKLKNDPRITRTGRFLRRSSLDELPQFWHVLTGDMSLVGPRPMIPRQVEIYGRIDAYVTLRPGITGPWQVAERNDSDFSSRARADLSYARHCSIGLDLMLIFRTFGVVLRGTGY